ncbi:MAG: hypothetical protein VX910_09070 [Candidatus Latescibacterota bacterium]|nr:hypothetical protein [Candidatus Latescibacterota bacterium]
MIVREGYDLWAKSYDATPNPLVALDARIQSSTCRPKMARGFWMQDVKRAEICRLC